MLSFNELKETALHCNARFAWAVGAQYQDPNGVTWITPVGPEYEDEDEEETGPRDFYEDTLLEVWGNNYDDQKVAKFVATFDPPTVLELIEMAAVRTEALYEKIGVVNGEPIYRRL